MEEIVDQQEARAEALAEVETDSAESRLAAHETVNDVERQLADLKAKKDRLLRYTVVTQCNPSRWPIP